MKLVPITGVFILVAALALVLAFSCRPKPIAMDVQTDSHSTTVESDSSSQDVYKRQIQIVDVFRTQTRHEYYEHAIKWKFTLLNLSDHPVWVPSNEQPLFERAVGAPLISDPLNFAFVDFKDREPMELASHAGIVYEVYVDENHDNIEVEFVVRDQQSRASRLSFELEVHAGEEG